MKNKVLKTLIATVSIVAATSYAGAGFAHQQNGALGLRAGANDLYMINCSNSDAGTAYKLKVRVKTNNFYPGLKVSARTIKGSIARNVTDWVSGDRIYSPYSTVIGGDGLYYVSVGKTRASSTLTFYSLEYHCMSSTENHTDTAIIMKQNM